jgi:hypothetical protein
MTQEKIEKIAKEEWDRLQMSEGLLSELAPAAWIHWKNAFKVCMSTYKWMDQDMEIAYCEGHSNSMKKELGKIDKVPKSNQWLKEYEAK